MTTESGLLILDKPAGMTSHDVVGRVRRALGTRKVGHAGTLDPMATGVLVVGVNKATRLLGHLALADKRYLATVRLGATTVTDDREGEILARASNAELAAIDDLTLDAALASLRGPISQRPSSVSAVKVDGRRSYERVRAGEDVQLDPRPVRIDTLDLLAVRREPDGIELDVDVECSTGTYIRALARDLGATLGVGGYLTVLRRTRVGPFTEMTLLDELAEQGDAALIAMSQVAAACFATATVDQAAAEAIAHGRRIAWQPPTAGGPVQAIADPMRPVALLDAGGALLALAVQDAGTTRYLVVFA